LINAGIFILSRPNKHTHVKKNTQSYSKELQTAMPMSFYSDAKMSMLFFFVMP